MGFEDRRVFRSIIHCRRCLLGQVLILSWSWLFVTLAGLADWLTDWLATKDNCIVWPKSTNQSSDPSSDDDFRTLFRFIVVLRRLGGFVRIVLAANEREVPLIIPSTTVATLFFVENV